MGLRNRLNEFMPMDVIVTTPAQRSRTMLRESGMSKAARSAQLCQIDAEITTESDRNLARGQKIGGRYVVGLTDHELRD
jgi:hypothetical protein